MRKTNILACLIAAVLLPPLVGFGQQPAVRWEPTLEAAQRLAAQTNRLVVIHFSAPWCEHCKWMEAQVFPQPAVVAALGSDYVAVKINADNFPATARKYGVTLLPTTVIALPDGRPLETVQKRMDASQYIALLTRVAADAKQRRAAMYAQIPGTPSAPTDQPRYQAAGQPPVATIADDSRYPSSPRGPQTPSTPIDQPPFGSGTPAPMGVQRNNGGAVQPMLGGQQPMGNQSPIAPQPPALSQPPVFGQSPINAQPPVSASVASAYGAASAPALPPSRDMGAAPRSPLGGDSVGIMPPSAPAVSPSPGAANPAPIMNPPLGLDGYCPVSLAEQQKWVLGDRRWGIVHRGRTYLFAGPEEQRRFFADPDRYAPAVSGNDIVLATEQGQAVPGSRRHGVVFENRIYLFSSEASLERFARNPKTYAAQAIEALRSGACVGRQLR